MARKATHDVLVLPDLQVPYEDKRSLAAVEKVMGEYEWDEIVQLGDCFDFDCYGDDACFGTVLYAAPMEQDCENGEDDEGDGAADCADVDCMRHCACAEPEDDQPGELCAPESQCADQT